MATYTLPKAHPSRRTVLLALTMPTGFLIAVLFATTVMHNRQLAAQAEQHNAQLASATATHNQQLVTMAEECNARLAAQAAEFQKRK